MEDINTEDELVSIKMSRKDYRTMKRVIEREQAHEWFSTTIKRYWIWVVGSGVLTLFLLYKEVFQKVT